MRGGEGGCGPRRRFQSGCGRPGGRVYRVRPPQGRPRPDFVDGQNPAAEAFPQIPGRAPVAARCSRVSPSGRWYYVARPGPRGRCRLSPMPEALSAQSGIAVVPHAIVHGARPA